MNKNDMPTFRMFLVVFFFWLACGPALVFAQLGRDNPAPVGPFLNGALPAMNPNSPAGSWSVVPAFPNISLPSTLTIEANPSNGELWAGSLPGVIKAFAPNPAATQARTIVNLSDRVTTEGGLIGIAFHPEFGTIGSPNKNYFYAYYASHCALNSSLDQVDLTQCVTIPAQADRIGFFGGYLRLSRFEYFEGATPIQVRDSETPMINIRLFNNTHRGGGPIFGNDGYMYLVIGEQQILETAQDIKTNLHGGLRIAVDITENGSGVWSCPTGSHMPRRTFQDDFNNNPDPDTPGHDDELSGYYYCVPDDNPWLDPTGEQNFEEYISLGHRNPHRVTLDRLSGEIWSGEVGSNQREEVNVISLGNNYGWPCREGNVDTRHSNEPYCQTTLIGTLTDPVIDFTRDEANALIGGYVYRGSKFPELYGKYLAGDYVLGHIYAVDYDRATGVASKTRLTTWEPTALGTWGQDLDGELYLGQIGANVPLQTLSQVIDSTPEPPVRLFDTGAFVNMALLKPAPFWLPYGLNQPFWSDGAQKSRWIAVPDGQQINFSENDNWDFPIGTVIMKHFDLPLDENDTRVTTRLETRFMVHGQDEWYGITYRWNADQTDAVLLTDSQTADYDIATLSGGSRTQTWQFPSRNDCLFCHNTAVAGVAGIRTHSLNGDFSYPKTGINKNQLRSWNQLGLFSPRLTTREINGYLKSVPISDTTAPLESRSRSWLDINCSYCHQPGGPGDRADFDMRLSTPLMLQNLVNGPVLEPIGLPQESLITPGCVDCSTVYQRTVALDGIAMPPLAKHRVDDEAIAILAQWINSLDVQGPPIGETGTVSVNQTGPDVWHPVNLQNTYVDPVVIVGSLGAQGGQPAFVRVRNVTTNRFEFQIDEWTNQDGRHVMESLSYLVMESGTFTLADGRRVTAGMAATVGKGWQSVNFSQPFAQTPVLFTQVTSVNDLNPVITRQNLVSLTGFDVRLQEEEARRTNPRSTERVHWVAIEPGVTAAGLEVGIATKGYNHEWARIDFTQSYSGAFAFLAAMQSNLGGDAATVRHRNLDPTGGEMMIQEEMTADSEINHRAEVIGYMVFPGAGSIH